MANGDEACFLCPNLLTVKVKRPNHVEIASSAVVQEQDILMVWDITWRGVQGDNLGGCAVGVLVES